MTSAQDVIDGLIRDAAERVADAQAKLDEALAAIASREDVAPAPLFGDFRLGKRSLERLEGVHPDMRAVTHYAVRVSPVDFGITRTGGVRTIETQHRLMGTGASKTLRSRHLTGHAVDIAPLDPKTGKYSKQPKHAIAIHFAFEQASKALDVPLRYGGDWDMDGILQEAGEFDLVHHELPRGAYGKNRYSQSKKAAAFLASIGVTS